MTREMNQSALEAAMNAVPLKRMGKPEEIAAAAAFLASDDARLYHRRGPFDRRRTEHVRWKACIA